MEVDIKSAAAEIDSTANLPGRALANRFAPVRKFVVLALSAAMAFAAAASTPFRLDLSGEWMQSVWHGAIGRLEIREANPLESVRRVASNFGSVRMPGGSMCCLPLRKSRLRRGMCL